MALGCYLEIGRETALGSVTQIYLIKSRVLLVLKFFTPGN